MLGAFGSARRAYNAHERVLQLAPARTDAGLIVGTYRYVIGSLVLPGTLARLHGRLRRRQGERAAAHRRGRDAIPSSATDAKFALVLLLNREARYDQAVATSASCSATTRETVCSGSRRARRCCAPDAPPRPTRRSPRACASCATTPGRACSAKRGCGTTSAVKRGCGCGGPPTPSADLTQALSVETQAWVKGRTHLELGKAADLAGDRTRARAEYDHCVQLCAAANDESAARGGPDAAHRVPGALKTKRLNV